jgi:Cdc6-like AAA superfamily ATPase
MFARKEVFRESWPPTRLPGRSRELERLSDILKPAAEGEPPEHCWEIGPSGAGKSTTAEYLLDRLEAYGVAHAHVECVGQSRWKLLQSITEQHPGVVPHGSMATEEMVDLLQESVDDPFVVILDEFDALEAPELLCDLYQADAIAMLCIGHDRSDTQRLVPDAAEGLRHAPIVEFEPYSTTAMLEILGARVEKGLQPDTVTDDQLERIAGRVGGSARYGVQALRAAVELGVERGHTTVREVDVDDCFERAQEDIREHLLDSLSQQYHIVYRVVREADGPLLESQVHERYSALSENPRTRQQVGNYLDKLHEYDLAEQVTGGWVVVDETLAAPRRERPAV